VSKEVVKWLNRNRMPDRRGETFGVATVHKILTNTVYIGEWRFNVTSSRTRQRKPEEEVVKIAVPAIIEPDVFEQVQKQLHARSPRVVAPRLTTGPILLTGLAVCAGCGGGNDIADRDILNWHRSPLLHLLHMRPKGKDGLQGPLDPDGQAGWARH